MQSNGNDPRRYDDIIHLEHHVSKKHPQMAITDRAAQFAPFAALTGHEAAINETARQTERKVELDEERQRELNEKIWLIIRNLESHPAITVTYFVPDTKKDGGAYITISGKVKRIDEYEGVLILRDGTRIPLDDIMELEGRLF